MIYGCIAAIAVLFLGLALGTYDRKRMQKDLCPKCRCRAECNIGHSVPAAEEVMGCFLCMRERKGNEDD